MYWYSYKNFVHTHLCKLMTIETVYCPEVLTLCNNLGKITVWATMTSFSRQFFALDITNSNIFGWASVIIAFVYTRLLIYYFISVSIAYAT